MPFYTKLQNEEKLTRALSDCESDQLKALVELIRIPSLKAAPLPGKPFGEDMSTTLDRALAMADSLGFATKNLDGYAGVIDFGDGGETLGVLVHLDVVPAGAGWTLTPFGGEIKDGRVYGRGTMDDKGPFVCALYALSAIKKAGISLKRKVRIIAGCDEESGWACMKHYKEVEPFPDLAFTPDAEYPLVFSERAIVHLTFAAPTRGSSMRIDCGERANVVPSTATANLAGAEPIIIKGKGAHASTPEQGINALQLLLEHLSKIELDAGDAGIVNTLYKAFAKDMHGESLGLDITDESGRLTLNPGILKWDENEARITIDARIPHAITPEDYIARVSDALVGFKLVAEYVQPGLFVDRESELVTKLMGVYQAQTGDTQSEPLAIGGGTYARATKNAVAFGIEFPSGPSLAHMADEYISIDDLYKNTRIMADAILALAIAE